MKTKNMLVLGTGVVIGFLLASIGFLKYSDNLLPEQQVKVVTVTKTVKKIVERVQVVNHMVDRVVNHTKLVQGKVKLYRAIQLDDNGNVMNQWEVSKCSFRVIGAQLTDKTGYVFDAPGNIKVEPIENN